MASFAEWTKEQKKKKKKSAKGATFTEYTKQVLGKDDIEAPLSEREDIAPVKTESEGLDFFQKGAFEDGYQFGDVSKAILGTVGDVGVGAIKGIAKMGGGIIDAGTYGVAGIADAFGNDDYADKLRLKAQENVIDNAFKKTDSYLDRYSLLGRTGDAVSEGLGQVGAIILTGGVAGALGAGAVGATAATTGVMGVSSFGSGMSEAYDGGATDEEAATYGLIKGVVDAGSELIFGGLGKAVKALGLSRGLSSLDDVFAQKLSSKITNHVAKNFVEYGVKASAEGVEEVLAGLGSAIGKKLTYMDDEELSALIRDENLLEQFVVGTVASGIAQSGVVPGMKGGSLREANETGRDFISGMSENEQKVVDKEFENRVAEQEKDGNTLSDKEKSKIYDAVVSDMEKGYISTDTIEEVLGGDTFQSYRETVDSEDALAKEFEELGKKQNATLAEQSRYNDLKQQLDEIKQNSQRDTLKSQLSEEVMGLVQNDRLAESYNERARRGQAYEADLTKYDQKQHAVIQKAVDSGILNNTRRTHEFVDMIAKISADKGVLFDFTNNEKLKDTSFAVDGKTVNGFVTKDGVTLNIDSAKSLNSVVGHEITHVLEGTDLYAELQSAVMEYAKTKRDYQSRVADTVALYKDIEGADPKAELTADLIGDYLFTDPDFINNLSTNNRNVFQKIYDEIKYLCKVATAGSKEARELEKVKRAFEKAYREGGKTQTEDADNEVSYSLVKDQETIDFLENQDYITTYKAMVQIDGKLYPPMASQSRETVEYTDKKGNKKTKNVRKLKNPSILGRWQQSDERPDLAEKTFNEKRGYSSFDLLKSNGKTVPAAYNPYEHTSNIVLNDQFEEAYNRPELVTVEYHIPVSELTSGYKAQYAKDAVGLHEWKSGPVAKDLKDPRKVYLTRWSKPVRILPDSEVAAKYKEILDGTGLSVPFNVVTPSLLSELEKAGVTIDYDGSPMYQAIQKRKAEKEVKYSVSDSNGKQLTSEQQEYFKDSKARDDDGNLLTLYHGTQSKFTVFDLARSGENYDGWSEYGEGIYLTPSKKTAEYYGDNAGWGREVQVMELYANLRNPFNVMEEVKFDISDLTEKYNLTEFDERYLKKAGYRLIDFLKEKKESVYSYLSAQGYDGLWDKTSRGIDQIVVYEENQVKNSDNLKPTKDVDIRYSVSDSDGKKLSKEQSEFFKDSKMRNDNGDLMVMYHGSENAGFHVFDPEWSDDEISLFFVDRNEVAASYSGTSETYEAKTIRTAEDMNNFLAEIGYDHYEAVEKNGKFELLENNDHVAWSDTAQGIYEEFCWYEGVGDGDANYKVYLNLKNPLVVDAEGRNWDRISTEFSQEVYDRYQRLTDEEKAEFVDLAEWEDFGLFRGEIVESIVKTHGTIGKSALKLSDEYGNIDFYQLFDIASDGFTEESVRKNANAWLRTRDYAQRAKEQGYDGVIFKNIHDNGGYSNGSEGASTVAIAFDSNQIKSVANEKPTADKDIRYSLSELDNAYQKNLENEDMVGAELAVERAANLAMPDSKIRDKNGDLIPVYHGTKEMFNVFDTSVKGGVNGTAEGFGIYTSDDPEVTEAYGDRQIKMYANITKPATSDKKTMTGRTLAALIKDTCQKQAQKSVDDGEYDSVKDALFDTWVSNYVYTYDTGMEKAYREVANTILQLNDNDMDIIQEVMASMAIRDYAEAYEFYHNSLIPITGFDGYVTSWENGSTGKKSNIILAFDSNQLKSADAVTYGDDGKVIPLSERFNPETPDIRYSVSGRERRAYGTYNVYGKDIALETVSETESVAPVVDAENATTTEPAAQYSVGDILPDDLAPMQSEIDRLQAEKAKLETIMLADPDNAELEEQWWEIQDKINALSKELAADESSRLNSLSEEDIPPEMEAPIGEEVPFEDGQAVEVEDPFENREVPHGNEGRKVNAYMYDNPEVRPFFQAEAYALLDELNNGTKGEKWYNDKLYYDSGGEQGYGGTKRHQSESIDRLSYEFGLSYDEIEKGLNAIIKDHGAENINAAKKIEFVINDRLMYGYKPFGAMLPPDAGRPNQDYIALMQDKQRVDSLAEADVPPISEEISPTFMDSVRSSQVRGQREVPTKRSGRTIVSDGNTPTHEVKTRKGGEIKGQQALTKEDATKNEGKNVANILVEEPKVDKKKPGAWSMVKNMVLDKGMVFEDLSLATGNRELQARWNSIRYAEGKAQRQMEKALKPIIKTVEQSGKTKQFYEYLYHLHNADRMTLEDRYDDVQNKPVFGDSVTAEVSLAEANKLLKANPEFKRWAGAVYSYNRQNREMLVEGGVISREVANLWEEMYPHYVPIRRVGDTGLNINVPLDTGRTGINAPIKRATGGSRDILPLFDTMGQRTLQTYKAIAKNRFGVELKNTLRTTIADEDMSIDEAIDGVDAHEELLQAGKNGKKPTFTVFEKGKKVTFEITDEMYDSMKPTSDILASTNKFLNGANNLRRGLLTEYNPAFMLTNPIKDTQDVLINSQHPARTYANYPRAVAELIGKRGRWYQEYMDNGGERNTYFEKDTNTFAKEKSAIRKIVGFPLDKISDINNFIERVPRLAEYIASRKDGQSIDVAMLDAARVTTNFAAGGDLTKFANRNGFTFLNASVQGFVQQVRNVREAKANGLKGALTLATKLAAAGLPAMLLNHLLWDDDEEYAELSDYVKQNYYIVGKYDDGKFVRIPKGRALAVIQNAFEQMENLITGDDEVDLATFAELAISNLAPNNPLENHIFAPIAQAWSNRTWYGDDLVPTRLQDLPAAEQYDETTDEISKWLGEKTNLSPYKLNYLLDQYSGGVGDMLLPRLTLEAERGDNSLIAPISDKFTTDGVLKNQNISDFYDTMDELTTNAKSSKATDEDVLKQKYMSAINSELSELYAQKREIQNSDLPDAEKYEEVRMIQQQIVDLTRNSLNSYEDVSIEGRYARVGNVQFRWYEPGEDSTGEPGWRKLTDKQSEKQDEVTSGLGIDASEYWSNKEEYDYAYEYPEKYAVAKSVGGYDAYKAYSSELYDIKADKDENGDSIRGSRKEKVIDWMNNLDADYGTKIILFKSEYNADDTYNYDIIEYLNSREDISAEEMETILKELGFDVDANGNISW